MPRGNELTVSVDDPREARLRGLLVQGQAGDAAAYHAFLRELAAHLRGFLRRRFLLGRPGLHPAPLPGPCERGASG